MHHRPTTKNNEHAICQQASSVHRHNQVHGTGPWLFHLAMSAAGYEDLLRLSTLQKQRGAAEKGSGLALADPHTHQTECLNCTHRPTKEDIKKGVSFWQPPPPRIEYLFAGSNNSQVW